MRNIIITVSLFLTVSIMDAQPKLSGSLGIGYTSPDYKTFAEDPFPKLGTFERMMIHVSFAYQFYPNARIGFSQWTAFTSDKYSGQDFKRSFNYRAISLETFFHIRRRIELNFTLAPMINSGKISMTSSQSAAAWDSLMAEFDNSGIEISSTDEMTKTFFGFTSSIGFRFYFKPYLAFEGKIGFLETFYKNDKWKFQGKAIKGPDIDIDDMPLFTFGLVYGW
ncbi:MAG: hypothetical protein IIB45_06575 [Candidatus Marinimicrobia bacterium]|nr:hypothetical protein [Candidatus Neomarinimicrobiota bacterium]